MASHEFPFGARGARPQESALRVLRGGSWNNNNRDNLLSSNRNNNDPDNRDNNDPDNRNENIGFRVVVEAGSGRKVIDTPKPSLADIRPRMLTDGTRIIIFQKTKQSACILYICGSSDPRPSNA